MLILHIFKYESVVVLQLLSIVTNAIDIPTTIPGFKIENYDPRFKNERTKK